MIKQAKTILKDVFGYEEFRSLQQEIIENVLKRKDSLVIMPTGGGKSLCYQIPALIFKGLTLVVSPLISLMEDQVNQLTELGIDAVVLNSSLSTKEYQDNIDRIKQNKVRLLYLAPETLMMQKTLALLSSIQVNCFTIDEAHCISEWGHDFRPEYRQLIEVRKRFPKAVCVALTATATPRVQQDIKKSLQFKESDNFIAGFNRKNLFLQIVPKDNPTEQTLEFIKGFPNQSGIIYCLARRQVDELTEVLANEGFSVKPYHAGLSDQERQENQKRFIRDDIQIMVATIAFGMGINKPNIRFVLHYDLPQNIESYYQQIGRAGRDGLHSICLFLFGYGDIQKIKFFISQKEESEQRKAALHLNAIIGLAETDECRRIPLLQYFGENYKTPKCEMCDNCLTEKKARVNVTIPAQQFLSCVKRTGEVFGAGHIIDVLRGSKAQNVLKRNHQELSTYGIGKDYSKKQWFHLSRQFIQKELIFQDMEFGSLKLTSKAWEVLKENQDVFARVEEEPKKQTQHEAADYIYDQNLFELLRQQRKKLADASNLPPYIIFPDKTLIDMATFFPQSREIMMELHGVGSVKFEKYGQTFLDLIFIYCQEHQIEERSKLESVPLITSIPKTQNPLHVS
jgi:ATP-dependent DNA helicase RecQ